MGAGYGSEHIRRPPVNLRLEEALSALALPLVGPLELARGNKPNDHGPHDEYPVRVGEPLMLNEVAAQRVTQSR